MQAQTRQASAVGLTGWTEPAIKGRDGLLDYLRELANSAEEMPRLVVLVGPRGAGTSTLAKIYLDSVRRRFESPLVVRVDVSQVSRNNGDPTHGISAALMRRFVPDSRFQGYSTPRLISLFLRRASVEGRVLIVWLDQLRSNLTSLDSVLDPLLQPETLLGPCAGVPPIHLILSGTLPDSLDLVEGSRVRVPALPRPVVREILVDRALQEGVSFTSESQEKALDLLATRNFDLTTLDELVENAVQRAGCHGIITEADVEAPVMHERPRTIKRLLDFRILEAVRKAKGAVPVGRLHQEVARGFTQAGQPVPSRSCLRRQMAKLERLGLVERELRMGGTGGTRCVVSLCGSHSSTCTP